MRVRVPSALPERNTMTLKDHIKGVSQFQFYRKGELYYKTETGLLFRVPWNDTGDAAFNVVEKSLIMMRWIRKELESQNG